MAPASAAPDKNLKCLASDPADVTAGESITFNFTGTCSNLVIAGNVIDF